ncbi:glycosyltransferase [Tolypothrix campylonemoides VB511288_2]|uniref:Glycosyltransferase n=3 Tax=Cyanophyceae TaxID=3028117 RepID=A0ABW8WE66_9CYAN
MRLIRLTTNYSTYIKQFYNTHSTLQNESYITQYQTLMSDCYMWADFWTHALKKLAYEVWEPVANAEFMQKVWARENGVYYDENSWLTDITLAQVKHFQPDIVFVFDYNSFSCDFLKYLRSECSSIKLIIGWCGAPAFTNIDVFKAFDLVLSNIPTLVEKFNNNGYKSKYMCHAFAPQILDKINQHLEKTIDLSFIGSIVKNQHFHNQRENLLKKLVQKTNLQIWADINQPSSTELKLLSLKQSLYDLGQYTNQFYCLKTILRKIPKMNNFINMKYRPNLSHYVDTSIAKRSQPPVFGIQMYQKITESKLTFNNHIDISANFASNMRLYEATGVGTCLITDWKENLQELFEPDEEVIAYRSAEEAMEKVSYLLEHDDERQKIAVAGQRRTLKEHTFEIRAFQLDKIIRNSLSI